MMHATQVFDICNSEPERGPAGPGTVTPCSPPVDSSPNSGLGGCRQDPLPLGLKSGAAPSGDSLTRPTSHPKYRARWLQARPPPLGLKTGAAPSGDSPTRPTSHPNARGHMCASTVTHKHTYDASGGRDARNANAGPSRTPPPKCSGEALREFLNFLLI